MNNPVVINSNFDDGNHDGWDCGTVHTCGSFGKICGKKEKQRSYDSHPDRGQTQAAVEEGIVPGGGIALLNGSKVGPLTLAATHHSFLGSISAVSRPRIARNGAFFQIFRDLQDFHIFAPLGTQNFKKIHYFCHNLANFPKFCKLF